MHAAYWISVRHLKIHDLQQTFDTLVIIYCKKRSTDSIHFSRNTKPRFVDFWPKSHDISNGLAVCHAQGDVGRARSDGSRSPAGRWICGDHGSAKPPIESARGGGDHLRICWGEENINDLPTEMDVKYPGIMLGRDSKGILVRYWVLAKE